MPPATTFFGEGTPPVDPASWRVVIHGRVARPVTLDLAALRSLGETDVVAILDCTSGWAVETTWGGVRLAHVLDAAGALPLARRVVVRSATGWSTSLSIDEAHDALLATAVAGAALPVANGAPVRLVVPTRRGLDWVKWVSEVSVG